MKPTFLRVGIPKQPTRAPQTVLPPTEGVAPDPATPAAGDVVTFTENTTNPTIDFPNSIVAGDYVVLWVRDNSSTPSGWTQLRTANPYTAVDTLYGKVVTASDVSAGTFTLPASAVTRGFVVRFDGTGSNWATSAPTPTVPSFSNNTNSQPDPPAAAPSAGRYWSLAGFHSNDTVTSEVGVLSFPSYTDLASLGTGGLTNYHGHVAIRLVDVTTNEDPGAGYHSMSITRGWVAFTLLLPFPADSDPTVVGYPVTASDIDTESATDGQVLTSDGAGNAAWESLPAPDLSSISIDALSDVDTTTIAPSTGNVLEWDGTNWVPTAASAITQYEVLLSTATGGLQPVATTGGDDWLYYDVS